MGFIQRPTKSAEIDSQEGQLAISTQPQVKAKVHVVILIQIKVEASDSGSRVEINAHFVSKHCAHSSGKPGLNIGKRHLEDERRIRPLDNDSDFAEDSRARLATQQACNGQVESTGDLAAERQWMKRNRDRVRIERPHLEPKFWDDAQV